MTVGQFLAIGRPWADRASAILFVKVLKDFVDLVSVIHCNYAGNAKQLITLLIYAM